MEGRSSLRHLAISDNRGLRLQASGLVAAMFLVVSFM